MIPMEDAEYEQAMKLKKERTWKEYLLRQNPKRKTNERGTQNANKKSR